jgi:integrase
MPVHKRKYRSGKVVWSYGFDAPGSGRKNRREIKKSGFTTKQAAIDAEAIRRIEAQRAYEAQRSTSTDIPHTLADLLAEFLKQRCQGLAPKTLERYRELAQYLDPALMALPIVQIAPLHFTREWDRLGKSGGHDRKGMPRPLASKTIRNVAGVVSSSFTAAMKWGLVPMNPVALSDIPKWRKKEGLALSPAQTRLIIEAATGCWCLPVFLDVSSATGARRGEVLALRWSDVAGGEAIIGRSLCQTKTGLVFKETKSRKTRALTLPPTALDALSRHKAQQDVFRCEFGPNYRADLDLIFCNPDGTPLRPDSISASVSALFRRLKLPAGASLHTLRHTHGSQLLAAGMELTAVSKRLGHANTAVTAAIYSHAMDGRDAEAALRWEEYQRKSLAQSACEPVRTRKPS